MKGERVLGDIDAGASMDVAWRRLMAAVLLQSFRDFWYADDLELALGGLYFLVDDAKVYCKVLGLRTDPLLPLTKGTRYWNRRQVT